jgi:hypothetical protein
MDERAIERSGTKVKVCTKYGRVALPCGVGRDAAWDSGLLFRLLLNPLHCVGLCILHSHTTIRFALANTL